MQQLSAGPLLRWENGLKLDSFVTGKKVSFLIISIYLFNLLLLNFITNIIIVTTGRLIINDEEPVIGTSPGRHHSLDLDLPLYVGSVPDFSDIPKSVDYSTGFRGMITNVILSVYINWFETFIMFVMV